MYTPMLDYWESLNLIKRINKMDDPAIANLAQKSDPEQWESEVMPVNLFYLTPL